jgi:colanic acid/amylovoran biosynthesis glycosyltransferase
MDTHPEIGREPGRVGYVVKTYPRYSETFIVNEILAHEAAGLSLEIFSLRPPSDRHFQDVISRVRSPVMYLPSEPRRPSDLWELLPAAGDWLAGGWATLEAARGEDLRDVYQALLLAKEARSRGITHLHAHFATVAATVARLAGRFAGISYTFTAHAKDIFHESVDSADLSRKLEDATSAVTVSDYNVQYLRARFGAAAANVRRVYNGLDLARFPFHEGGNRGSNIVAVGRLVEKKGFADLIEACSLLRESGHEFRCDIIGSGPLRDDLQARIEHHELSDRVQLLGPRPQSEVMEQVRNAAVFAAPCVEGADGNRDGLPTVLLEAMALGTPCISTDVTGIPEILRDGETGLLVGQRDVAGLAVAIEALITDVALGARLARQARRLIETEFDIHSNTRHLREHFRPTPPAEAEAA